MNDEPKLPKISDNSSNRLEKVTNALGIDRDVLPNDKQINDVWNNLPKHISRVPTHLRDQTLVRLCVAVSSGLFDSAINYAWNLAVIELRNKVKRFGVNVVRHVTQDNFSEDVLFNLKDSELLDLCLQLNLISTHGNKMLHQCRD